MGVRIDVVDPGSHGLGTAIGLRQLGHEVRYFGGHSAQPREGWADGVRRELVAHVFGEVTAGERPGQGSDLLVLVDVFADYLHTLHTGIGPVGVEPSDPMQDDAGALIYPMRLQYFCELAQAAQQVAVIDMSDHRERREVAFEALPNAQLFAREVHGERQGKWRPFPFLYNLSMLWLEHTQAEQGWLTRENRPQSWDWAFCGTVAHERYGRRRELAISLIAERWPQMRGAVLGQETFEKVIAVLQSVRFGLDLPGVGELCFRMHECLALGTPVWRPLTGKVALPPGLEGVVATDPEQLQIRDVDAVRAIYAEHYGPRAAATWLLEKLQNADQYWIYQATNIAPIASK